MCSSDLAAIMGLPLRAGGLGLEQAEKVAPLAHVAAFVANAPTIVRMYSEQEEGPCAMAAWLAGFGSPRLWRSESRQRDRREPKRVCDEAFRTPMAPMNLRVFKQTFTLIAELLRPLADAGVRIEPVQAATSNVTVCEGCPASVLRLKGWPDHGYKGQGEPPRRVRADLLQRLQKRERLELPRELASAAEADPEGDLLDAILLVTDPLQWVPPSEARVEGWIY